MKLRHRSFAHLLLTLLVMSVPCTGAALAAPTIHVLLSEPAGIYQAAAESLTRELNRDPGNWNINTLTLDRYASQEGDLTVAIGTKALEAALARRSRPVLSLLVPRLTYERLASGKAEVSALYLDQPLSRQLQLLGLALPGVKRVGVPLGPASQAELPALQGAAKDSGMQVGSAQILRGQDLHAALNALAEQSQAFVLLPDPVVAQRSTLQNFFLHTYRLKRPVLAYSAPLAQSGALLALYATPAQQGEEAAVWIRESWGSEFRLGAPRYPKRFTIAVNRIVARSLDLALPSRDALTRQLEAIP